ncbi:hypothetical protein MNB_SV-6-1195 [hydrothermal vent metagenome]|uniref:Uncharacterized protein n=1 Tax=hydrothermal vent metagenome TaxID=652676 RepID=A0A1W1BFA7_9ZZZZ
MAEITQRRIIYVDASYNSETKESKISLYDKEISKLDTLILTYPNNSSEAEKSAILYACLYSKKKAIEDRKIHILNDNFNATVDEKILDICKYFGVNVSWIPREINAIADKGTKLDVNIGEQESNLLEVFYDLTINKCILDTENSNLNMTSENKSIEVSSKTKNILINAIRHSTVENKPYVSIGQVGKYLKENNPTFEYGQLKKELEKYPDDFIVIDNNYTKLK